MRNPTYHRNEIPSNALLVDKNRLQNILSCGYVTAAKIAADAGAELKIGRRTLYNVEKIKAYINKLGG